MPWRFDNTYTQLPEIFYKQVLPSPASNPQLLIFNEALAEALDIPRDKSDVDSYSNILAGNKILEGSVPIAQAYAGHQFGHFTMLGDGRAILLGEHLTSDNERYDIQLKGAGQTPYSRRGDGRATLRSMLREYIISEAMFHLGIPTSRSLAVVSTGDSVYRETTHNGAVLTRVMSSHIRVGTFEYARQFGSIEDQQALLHYTLQRHYPHLLETPRPALELVRTVLEKQVALVINWLRVGFVHGVMNTDNMGIACETYDYGPCAFMNHYHPKTVFSSIDRQGRYAFENQPFIAHWNVSVLAGALLPLIDENEDKAIELAQAVLDDFEKIFIGQWYQMMLSKIGIEKLTDESKQLLTDLMEYMHKNAMDYTNTFRSLIELDHHFQGSSLKEIHPEWLVRWEKCIAQQTNGMSGARLLMAQVNPAFIPRNHVVEFVLDLSESGNLAPLYDLLEHIKTPYTPQHKRPEWNSAPLNHDKGYVTFCGT
jgi:uncharacterized protein YdiU (UPF0061 family)